MTVVANLKIVEQIKLLFSYLIVYFYFVSISVHPESSFSHSGSSDGRIITPWLRFGRLSPALPKPLFRGDLTNG